MYESHFGITRSPFQLTPDPWFYFDSRGHHHALAALRQGCSAGGAFVVVSGDIGSGKSMLVRSRLDEFDGGVVVGYIASSRLSGEELRRAVASAFGMPLAERSIASWETEFSDLLTSLEADGRRAVLIIDEAQHLDPQGLAMLEALAPRSSEDPPLLEVWLIGQPELRKLLATPELGMLRKRIGVSCHLGPLEPLETQAYIEHRLRKVGWTGRPHFEVDAFEAIHRCTNGLPRQINRLCNRLLLGSFLSSVPRIDAVDAVRAARDLQLEIEGREPMPGAFAQAAVAPTEQAADRAPAGNEGLCEIPATEADARPLPESVASDARLSASGTLLLVVGGQADHIRAAVLMNALAACSEPLACKLVRAYRNDAFRLHRVLFENPNDADECVELDVTANAQAVQTAQVTDRLERLFQACSPCGVVVFDGSELALACTVVAAKRRIPVANVGAGVRLLERTRTGDLTRTFTDRLASLLYTSDEVASHSLQIDGIAAERVHCLGNLVSGALTLALRKTALGSPAWQSLVPGGAVSNRRGYGVVVLNQPANVERRDRLSDVVQVLRQARRDLPLVWAMERRTEQRLKDFGLSGVVASERIACLAIQPYPDFVQMLKEATCVLSDSSAVNDEALVLGVPCLGFFDSADRDSGPGADAAVAVGCNPKLVTRALWNILYAGGRPASVPAQWDSLAPARIAEHLSSWMRLHARLPGTQRQGITASAP